MFLRQPRQSGFSLVELMVAMVVGLFVAAIVATMYVGIIRANSTTVQLARLNQDLQASLDVMARDIQRAGYVSGAEAILERDGDGNPVSSALATTVTNTMFSAIILDGSNSPKDLNADGHHCILIRYDANGDGVVPTASSAEVIGYRFNETLHSIEYRVWTDINQECDDDDWTTLAGGDGQLDINNLTFTLDPAVSAPYATSGAYATTGQRYIIIDVSGASSTNGDIRLSLSRSVRLRNDQY
ncbi:MAG: prepilin-type N-terminal cleavage/methylation domain-containing protein [Gammaproteobacteria bacterium]|nr:prepilin-type N-terminal cleavage/methylation domain-containing protein [Gammaproteobacteria bacterium]